MGSSLSRRTFVASAIATVAAPALRTRAAADAPLVLRCSLETAPSHTRNAIIRDYLGRIESAAGGKIKTQLFESGQLFPDLQVGKALLQGQVEMAAPGSWSLTGFVPDADFIQLPVLYGRSMEMVHRAVDGKPGQLLAKQIEQQLLCGAADRRPADVDPLCHPLDRAGCQVGPQRHAPAPRGRS